MSSSIYAFIRRGSGLHRTQPKVKGGFYHPRVLQQWWRAGQLHPNSTAPLSIAPQPQPWQGRQLPQHLKRGHCAPRPVCPPSAQQEQTQSRPGCLQHCLRFALTWFTDARNSIEISPQGARDALCLERAESCHCFPWKNSSAVAFMSESCSPAAQTRVLSASCFQGANAWQLALW